MPRKPTKSKPAIEPPRLPEALAETAQALIQQQSRLVRIALDGFLRMGRGAVLLQHGAERYAPLSELRRDHAAAASAAERYAPGASVIVVRDGAEIFSLTPRDGAPAQIALVATVGE